MIPNPQTDLPLARIPVQSAGEAINVLRSARAFCLMASYHPHGGDSYGKIVTTPITHTVWVMGKASDISEFIKVGAQ